MIEEITVQGVGDEVDEVAGVITKENDLFIDDPVINKATYLHIGMQGILANQYMAITMTGLGKWRMTMRWPVGVAIDWPYRPSLLRRMVFGLLFGARWTRIEGSEENI